MSKIWAALLTASVVAISVIVGLTNGKSPWWVWAIVGVVSGLVVYVVALSSAKKHLKKKKKKKKKKRQRSAKKESDDKSANRMIRKAIKTGLLVFDIPTEMVQGKRERVDVGIARSPDLRETLISGLHGKGEPQFEEIETSIYMEVRLSGPTFEVTCHNPAEQLIIPTPAHWQFDVLPCRAGRRQITLFVTMRIEAEGVVRGRRGVSLLEKQIDIQVNIGYAARRFVAGNWQWLIPTVLALAGTIAAWLVVPF